MKLVDILDKDLIVPRLKAEFKDAAISEMAFRSATIMRFPV